MTPRLLKTLKNTAAYLILPSAFFITSVQPAQSEELYLFLSPEITVPVTAAPRSIQQKKLKIDEKGDLLIQYGGTRFTVAYNEPEDQFKPTEQQKCPQRDRSAAINGISLTASLYF